ncbi:hypothetical protein BBOR36S_05042 [Brevibacillus borstelensis]|jgi:hypothetical protein
MKSESESELQPYSYYASVHLLRHQIISQPSDKPSSLNTSDSLLILSFLQNPLPPLRLPQQKPEANPLLVKEACSQTNACGALPSFASNRGETKRNL